MHHDQIENALARLRRSFDELALARDRLAEGLERAIHVARQRAEDVDLVLRSHGTAVPDLPRDGTTPAA